MKKLFAFLLVAVMIFSFAACGGDPYAKAAKEIEEIIGEEFTVDDLKEAMEELGALSNEEVTPDDVVEFYREMYDLKDKVEGDNGDGVKITASNKADGAKMVEDVGGFGEGSYEVLEELSGISSLGKPEGYECKGSGSAGEARDMSFAKIDGEFSIDDVTPYAAAIWNACIDIADEGGLFHSYGSEILKSYVNLSDAKKSSGNYGWCYNHNGKMIMVSVGPTEFKEDEIVLEIKPLN